MQVNRRLWSATAMTMRTLALATCALGLLPAVAAAQAPPPRSYAFSIGSEPGAPYASGSFAEATFGEASERPTPVRACVRLTRHEQGGTRKRPTTTTVTESGCGTLDLFLPYAGRGTLSGAIRADSGGELWVEDVALDRVPLPRAGSAPPQYCSFLPPLYGDGAPYWVRCHSMNVWSTTWSAWVAVREEGTAKGTVRSAQSGAAATGTGPLVGQRPLTCVGPGCPR